MRIAAPETGPLALAALRMTISGLVLLPLFLHYWFKRKQRALSSQLSDAQVMKHICVVALINSAIPMILFAFAAANLDAGFASILNATTPLWGALIGAVLFGLVLSKSAVLGLLIGFIGVVVLSWDKLNFNATEQFWSVLAIVTATCCYGIGTNYSKRFLTGVKPVFIAAASLFCGSLILLPLLIYSIDDVVNISLKAWLATFALGSVATGLAYLLFYRLVDHSGPTKAMMVTYLIPIFGVLFGHLFLVEQVTLAMLKGAALILLGVALTTGLIKRNKLK